MCLETKEAFMGPFDILILIAIAVAFIAVCVRVRRKGACADCAQGATCDHARTGGCPAAKGVDAVADELGRGVR